MTLENSKDGTIIKSLSECPCVFFNALLSSLPSDLQEKNRGFRQAAREGKYDNPGVDGSMCGICVHRRRTKESIDSELKILLTMIYPPVS